MAIVEPVYKEVSERMRQAHLYVIATPSSPGEDLIPKIEQALQGGADIIQLRDKVSSELQILEAAQKIKDICESNNALFILNDNVELALVSGADGVHLGQDDMEVEQARMITERTCPRESFLIGRSTHSLPQALKAQEEGADYLGCGPVFATPTKPDYKAQGLELVKQYKENIKVPFVAIGGIDDSNVAQVIKAGASCVAVVRAVLGANNPEARARSLKRNFL